MDKYKIEKLFKLYNTNHSPKKNRKNTEDIFLRAKQAKTEAPEDHWEEMIKLEKNCNSLDFSTNQLISKIIMSKTENNLRDKLRKEKDSNVPMTVKKKQQNAYNKKKQINTTRETS